LTLPDQDGASAFDDLCIQQYMPEYTNHQMHLPHPGLADSTPVIVALSMNVTLTIYPGFFIIVVNFEN
jgi:hypothetical protein